MKYVLIVILTALIVGLGVVAYFKGWLPTLSFNKPQAVSTQNAEVSTLPASTPSTSTTVTAGGILSMSAYSITFPGGWQYSKSGSVAGQSDKLTLTNGDYSITISQGAFGGGGCLYPGDPDAGMSQRFVSYTSVTDQSGDNLRVGALAAGGMVVCQSVNGNWGDITSFGHISIAAPATSPKAILDEINSILSSIKKLPKTSASGDQAILDAVKAALIAKHGSDFSSLNYTLSKVEGNYASGSVSGTGGGGMWFAANVSGSWVIVSDGNGTTLCSDLTPYPNFPTDMIPQCWDSSTNKLITR